MIVGFQNDEVEKFSYKRLANSTKFINQKQQQLQQQQIICTFLST